MPHAALSGRLEELQATRELALSTDVDSFQTA
jgi:hypothetical protein